MEGSDGGIASVLGAMLSPHGPARPAVASSYTPADYSLHLFLQLAAILLACRLFGWLGRRFLGQPQVVGEMIAGVALGPSLLGAVWPEAQAVLFPGETRGLLYAGAQLGVGLYMFLVGTTLHVDRLRESVRGAAAVSFAGIAAPFVLAALIAPLLLRVPGLFAPGITPASATLFLGASMALTAFPMLARIITEHGLAGTRLGTLSLTAGAFDDAVSWCVLAVVLAAFGAGPGLAVVAIGGAALYAAALLLFGRRLLAPLGRAVERADAMSPAVLSIVLALFCLSAFAMDAVGVHAIFGGFMLGAAMPRGRFAEEIRARVEPLTVALLLPMFFTYSGLNTQLGTVGSVQLLPLALLVLAASLLAKGGACYLAARLSGEQHRTALGIGALMNARGLMELIIVNIGLEHGVIGPSLFAILVLMAVVTTMLASPLLRLALRGASLS